MFVLNTTFGIKIAWKVIETFMAVHMKSKMMLSDKNTTDELVSMFHPSQLEEKFGGEAENTSVYWPPIMPSDDYGIDKKLLASKSEYSDIIKENPQLKINPKFKTEIKSEKFEEAKDEPQNVAYLLHSNFISQMEINSSTNIQRKSMSVAEDRRYSQVLNRFEHSVQMNDSELTENFEYLEKRDVKMNKEKRKSRTENNYIPEVARKTFKHASAYSMKSTKEGTLELIEGEVEENVHDDDIK